MILAISAFALMRPHKRSMPSDFRDAVGGAPGEFSINIPELNKIVSNIPEPKAPKAGHAAQKKTDDADYQFMSKGPLPAGAFYRKQRHPVMTAEDGGKSPAANPESRDRASVDKLKGLPGAMAFDKLKNLFEEGVPAAKEDLAGWHSGRAVSSGEHSTDTVRNRFYGALLVGANEGGPLFEAEALKLSFFMEGQLAPDYFDVMSEAAVSKIKESLLKPGRTAIMVLFPGAKGINTDTFAGYKFLVEERKARGYVVEHLAWYDKKTDQMSVEYYSYYFKDVTPK
jgi:hypothetical protein